jgi:hypothetical protein
VWFRTAWSHPFALFAYMTNRWPDVTVTMTYSGGYAIDYVGRCEFKKGVAKNTRLSPDQETHKALATFSKRNPWFNYKQWKEVQTNLELADYTDLPDTYEDEEEPQHVGYDEATYERLVCEYNDHGDYTNDLCDVCRASNDPANYVHSSH